MAAGSPTVRLCDVPVLRARWKKYLERRGRSACTVRIYLWGLGTLLRSIDIDDRPLSRDVLEDWQDSLTQTLHPRSGALARTAMHQFLQWLADEELCDPRLEKYIVGVKVEKRRPRPLAPNDLVRITAHLIERCDPVLARFYGYPPPSVRDLRDRALFHYIIATAGRVSEVLQVHRSTFERETIRQKGGSPKEFTCPPGVAGLIHQYLVARTDDLDLLWIAFRTDGTVGPLQDAGVLKIWERLARRYCIKRFTTHQLRHTAATLLSERGHDPLVIAAHLGHVDTRSVQLYTKVAASRLQLARADLDAAI